MDRLRVSDVRMVEKSLTLYYAVGDRVWNTFVAIQGCHLNHLGTLEKSICQLFNNDSQC